MLIREQDLLAGPLGDLFLIMPVLRSTWRGVGCQLARNSSCLADARHSWI